ncbi:hypothetical protein [Spiroplasma endosymbiont of Crioceris asparagi]|uniref:hypothetical protein n=1 Tax=Spiroplasma endosymbiont of Crioceris asparagi TaxID=3066286 RepID=UPI0030D54802
MQKKFIKIKSQSIQWGFPIALLNTYNNEKQIEEVTIVTSLMNFKNFIVVALQKNSSAYKNILSSENAVLNILDENNYRRVDKSYKTKEPINSWLTVSESQFANLSRYEECPISMDLYAENISSVDAESVHFVRFKIKNVFVKQDCLDEEGYIIDKNIRPLIYKFRNYYRLEKKPIK